MGINVVNDLSFDLRLLRVFDAVFTEGSMSGAARRLGLTQPAVSNAIRRLRLYLKDELFVRSADGVVPTTRALEIAKPIREALQQLEAALAPPTFRPEIAEDTFCLAISTNAAPILLPALYAQLKHHAPGISLRVQEKRNSMIPTQLDSAEIDFAAGVINSLPDRFERETLYSDRIVCAIRKDRVPPRNRLTREEFASARHVSVYPAGEGVAYLDQHFQDFDIRNRTSLSINHLLLVPEILDSPDVILTGFRSVIVTQPAFAEFRIVESPLQIAPVTVSLAWHRGRGRNPGHAWFKDLIVQTAAACFGADSQG